MAGPRPRPHIRAAFCRGDEEIHTLTSTELRKMKLYSDARVRYTLNKAVSIAYACGSSLKASDFGFVDQVSPAGGACLCIGAAQGRRHHSALHPAGSDVPAPRDEMHGIP